MATRFLNSLSSIMYAAQIFGIMPVLHRRGRPRGRIRQLTRSSSSSPNRVDVGTPPPPVTMTVLDLHDRRVFGEEDDANGRVNITTTRRRLHTTTKDTKDYVRSDKSSNVNEQSTGRSTGSGDSNTSYYVTQFNWKYPNTVYSVLLIVLGVGEWGCTVHDMTKFGVHLGTIGAFNFYTIANFGLIMFFNLARKWTQLHSFWTDTARIFDELPYRSGEINPGVKIRTIFWTWALAALVDTVLFRTVSVMNMIEQKRVCKIEQHILELVYKTWRAHIYHVIEFQFWQIPFLEVVNLALTFTWTYVDVFIMMISIGLRGLFEVFEQRLIRTTEKRMPYTFWIEIRTHYVILRNLVEFVDQHISILIVISFASNLYFSCLQLFNSFTQNYKSWIHIMYFCNTMVMVIVRAMTVLKYAAGIASVAKRPLKVLRQIPTEFWNDELQRLFHMMSHDVVALSGCGFFYLTKSLFLVLVGTVATYELVIMDIHSEVSQPDGGIVC